MLISLQKFYLFELVTHYSSMRLFCVLSSKNTQYISKHDYHKNYTEIKDMKDQTSSLLFHVNMSLVISTNQLIK